MARQPESGPVMLEVPRSAAGFLDHVRQLDAYLFGGDVHIPADAGPDSVPLLAAWRDFHLQAMAHVMSKAYPPPAPSDGGDDVLPMWPRRGK